MTLIRLVRALPMPVAPSPSVLGVDDFALRRRHRFGTVLVDVATSEVVDLLPDRSATGLCNWLGQREPPEFICRDRVGDYANGARQGAPDAVQIADRFHLACNSSQALECVLHRHAAALRACVRSSGEEISSPAQPRPLRLSPSVGPSQAKRARRLARYDAVVALHAEGLSITAIAAKVALVRSTVRKDLRAGGFPEWSSRRTPLSAGTGYGEYVRTRWEEAYKMH